MEGFKTTDWIPGIFVPGFSGRVLAVQDAFNFGVASYCDGQWLFPTLNGYSTMRKVEWWRLLPEAFPDEMLRNINPDGSYPMFHDMHVDKNGNVRTIHRPVPESKK
ncbi:MAG: hypothetical protein HQL07_00520 [Nitrospirae bacterium]|nr:hypothetical protein [Magnetococcales bacterium]